MDAKESTPPPLISGYSRNLSPLAQVYHRARGTPHTPARGTTQKQQVNRPERERGSSTDVATPDAPLDSAFSGQALNNTCVYPRVRTPLCFKTARENSFFPYDEEYVSCIAVAPKPISTASSPDIRAGELAGRFQ